MRTMWKKAIRIICVGGLSVLCLAGCGKDEVSGPKLPAQEILQSNTVGEAQANNHATDGEAQANNYATDNKAQANENTLNDGVQTNKENDAPPEQGADHNAADDGVSGSRGDGKFLEGANLQGTVVEFSETGFTLSPASTGADDKVLAEAAPGSESDENNVQIIYTDNTVFQIVTYSKDSWSELSREDTDKESVKKRTSVAVFASCQDTYHWTAERILIIRFQ